MLNIKSLSAFVALQFISSLIFIVGYFVSERSLILQSGNINPFFNRTDWFVPQFSNIVFIVDRNIDEQQWDLYMNNNKTYHQKYAMDFLIDLDQEDLLNILMRGINPISLLQYALVEMDRWDSIPHQINKQKKNFCISSNNNYDQEYFDLIKYIRFKDSSEDSYFKDQDCQLIYIDNMGDKADSLSSMKKMIEKTWNLDAKLNTSTLFMILKKPQKPKRMQQQLQEGLLWLLSGQQLLGQEVREKINSSLYNIDSIASTLACLLNIPIPIQNHGVMLPGIYYKVEVNQTLVGSIENIQFYDQLVNFEQLSKHLQLLDKKNFLFIQQEDKLAQLESMLNQQLPLPVILDLIKQTRDESQRINNWLDQEISGNPYILLFGIILSQVSVQLLLNQWSATPVLQQQQTKVKSMDGFIILFILVIGVAQRKYQLFVASLILIGFLIYITFKEQFYKNFKILLQVLGALFYINYTNYFSSDVQFSTILFQIFVLMILCKGLWGLYHLKINIRVKIFVYLGILGNLIQYIPIELIQYSGYGICISLSGFLLINNSLNIRKDVKLIIIMLLNFSIMNNFIPLSLIFVIIYICHAGARYHQSDQTGDQKNLIINPAYTIFYLVIYQASLSQFPQSPYILNLFASLVQIYVSFLYIFVGGIMKKAYKQQGITVIIVETLLTWSKSVESSVGTREYLEYDVNYNFKDIIISQALLIWFNWVCILINEVLHYDTRLENLGQEYYYLQDTMSNLFSLIIIICLSKFYLRNKQVLPQTDKLPHQEQKNNEDDQVYDSQL